jgi:hypothetical protein
MAGNRRVPPLVIGNDGGMGWQFGSHPAAARAAEKEGRRGRYSMETEPWSKVGFWPTVVEGRHRSAGTPCRLCGDPQSGH